MHRQITGLSDQGRPQDKDRSGFGHNQIIFGRKLPLHRGEPIPNYLSLSVRGARFMGTNCITGLSIKGSMDRAVREPYHRLLHPSCTLSQHNPQTGRMNPITGSFAPSPATGQYSCCKPSMMDRPHHRAFRHGMKEAYHRVLHPSCTLSHGGISMDKMNSVTGLQLQGPP